MSPSPRWQHQALHGTFDAPIPTLESLEIHLRRRPRVRLAFKLHNHRIYSVRLGQSYIRFVDVSQMEPCPEIRAAKHAPSRRQRPAAMRLAGPPHVEELAEIAQPHQHREGTSSTMFPGSISSLFPPVFGTD